jgi:hypothetical protein
MDKSVFNSLITDGKITEDLINVPDYTGFSEEIGWILYEMENSCN